MAAAMGPRHGTLFMGYSSLWIGIKRADQRVLPKLA
jgi:hypothetical protein